MPCKSLTAAALLFAATFAPAQKSAAKDTALHIYFADVEGGQATLIVSPTHESLLIDTGWPGFNSRDAKRIVALATRAGISRIDNVILTHYHVDHTGGLTQLAALIPIGGIIDHGPNREPMTTNDGKGTLAAFNSYQQTLTDKKIAHLTVKPGETLPFKSLHAQVVSADGEVITKPFPGGGSGKLNPACAASPLKPIENGENDRSVGILLTFGKLRILDLGDLTWGEERPLMCPIDNLGRVDVYIVSHHGVAQSNSPALLEAIAPRVAIMDNGATKGAIPAAWENIQHSPRIIAGEKDGSAALWQLHTATKADAAHNVPDSRIANLTAPGPTTDDAGNFLELIGRVDGSISVFNSRTAATVKYPAR